MGLRWHGAGRRTDAIVCAEGTTFTFAVCAVWLDAAATY
jgi:hypothetical protein